MVKKKENSKYPNISGLSSEIGTMIEDFDSKLTLVSEQTSRMEKILNEHTEVLEVLKTDMELVKYGLKRKVDIDDFQALERRVALLESRR